MAFSIRTDLASEARELQPELSGVYEESQQTGDITCTRIRIETEAAAKALGKGKGNYITLEAPRLLQRQGEAFREASNALAKELLRLMDGCGPCESVLVIGLGNRAVTPDSLGPRVAEAVCVTRHIKQYLPDVLPKPVRAVSAVAPGVLGITGVETLEIVKGIAAHCKPDLIIAVDALASRRTERISTALQLSDAGICPGAGVGNARQGLTKETLGVPVIALGVPLVVYASTISRDTIGLIAGEMGLEGQEEQLKTLAEKLIAEHTGELIVTPKEIDSILSDMTRILADGINMALFGADYETVRTLIA
ncbi:MAG: GPR endopeptidase [Clostridiales bacterium]|nr:GPR endopeptidase [Clostridiales bacterium]